MAVVAGWNNRRRTAEWQDFPLFRIIWQLGLVRMWWSYAHPVDSLTCSRICGDLSWRQTMPISFPTSFLLVMRTTGTFVSSINHVTSLFLFVPHIPCGFLPLMFSQGMMCYIYRFNPPFFGTPVPLSRQLFFPFSRTTRINPCQTRWRWLCCAITQRLITCSTNVMFPREHVLRDTSVVQSGWALPLALTLNEHSFYDQNRGELSTLLAASWVRSSHSLWENSVSHMTRTVC